MWRRRTDRVQARHAAAQVAPQIADSDRWNHSIHLYPLLLALGPADSRVSFVHDDVTDHPFELESFDLVVSVAALHHLDTAAALIRFKELLKPEGE